MSHDEREAKLPAWARKVLADERMRADIALHPFPNGTPTDAELAADRDADHAREIAAWEAGGRCLCGFSVRCAGRCECGAT